MNDWKEYKIGDLCSKITSGGTPSTRKKEYYGGKVPWLRTQEINFNRIRDTELFITDEGLNESSAKWIPKNSVIMAMYGATAGKVAINKIPLTTNQACCNLIINGKKADYHFIYYNLLSRYSNILNMAVGAAQQNLNVGFISQLNIRVPDLSEQRAIAEILSSLDDKIELNNRINKNLEELAQAIFKRWFVDFEFPYDFERGMPNLNGKPYKSSGGEFIDSELGLIPEGWNIGNLGDILELAYGKALRADNRVEGAYPVVGSNGIVGYHKEFIVKGPGIVIGRKGTIGEVIWLNENFYPIDTTFYVIDKLATGDLYFHYYLLKEQDFKKIGSDSAVPGLNREEAYKNTIIIPSKTSIINFNTLLHPIFNQITALQKQNGLLNKLRNTILPKLISGEIRVKEAEILSM